MEQNLTNATVSYDYNAGKLIYTDAMTNIGTDINTACPWYPLDWPYYHTHWVSYYPCSCPNKTEQSFKIVQILMKKGYIKNNISVMNFIELINELAEIL